MLLSIIIVSYNARYFLEQCLCSVGRALRGFEQVPPKTGIAHRDAESLGLEIEVFVVDNNSPDGNIEYLGAKFPFVHFIANTENAGFAKANNQALQLATGQYILFLNPDTIVPEDGFNTCISFMKSHPDSGALGVRMIDGSGRFLKESKRGFPSPWASFCKMSGLTVLFPSSKIFAGYYLGHLPEKQQHIVDVLSGAYMLVRKDVLDKTGGFDEQFFMYAEDIDLSYRIRQSGYKNYYLPDCTVIHFKGESTTKDSRYVKLFYQAMIQFVRKHFKGGGSWLYIGLLKMMIWLRGRNNNVQEQNENSKLKGPIMMTGDQQSITEATKIIANIPVVPDPSKAEGIILCEGPSFSFKQVILQLQELPDHKKAFIHGCGTLSATGSHSKNRQGEVIG